MKCGSSHGWGHMLLGHSLWGVNNGGTHVLETGIGGVKSPKIRGGVKILNFEGPLKLTPFHRDSIENRQFGGQKSL